MTLMDGSDRPIHTQECEDHAFCHHAATGGDADCICGADKSNDSVIVRSLAHRAAQDRLASNGRSIRGAFDSLALGWSMEDVAEYMQTLRSMLVLSDAEYARLVGAAMGFAVTCVVQDRLKRRERTA